MKLIFIDLEVSPAKGYHYDLYETNILKQLDRQHLLSFAWQEYGKKTIHFEGVDTQTEEQLTKKLWKVFNEADVLCAHNNDRFDIKMAKTFFILYHLNMPSSFQSIDTLKLARKHFKFTGNSLDQLADYFDIPNKIPHDKSMFIRCHENHKDRQAWRLMRKYNKHDVWILEKLYKIFLPFIDNHPNRNAYDNTEHKCPNCGSYDLMKQGYRYTRAGKNQQFQCRNCKSWSTKIGKILR